MGGNVDWDAAWQAFSAIAYGPGSRVLVAIIMGYFMAEGLFTHRKSHVVLAIAGAILYFGSGVLLGKIGIA